MFLNCNLTQSCEVAAVPRQMCVAIAESRHESPTSAPEDPHVGVIGELFDIRDGPYGRDLFT